MARAKDENKEMEHPGFQVEGNDTSGYVGVSPEYQNYANESEAPLVDGDEDEAYAKARAHQESLAHENYGGKSPTATHPSEAGDQATAAPSADSAEADEAPANDDASGSTAADGSGNSF